jgi:hypothetical protein
MRENVLRGRIRAHLHESARSRAWVYCSPFGYGNRPIRDAVAIRTFTPRATASFSADDRRDLTRVFEVKVIDRDVEFVASSINFFHSSITVFG